MAHEKMICITLQDGAVADDIAEYLNWLLAHDDIAQPTWRLVESVQVRDWTPLVGSGDEDNG